MERLLYDWMAAKENQVRYSAAAPSLLGKWKPPVEGFKCNVDATYNEAGVGMVVRNTAGQFVEAMCMRLGVIQNSLMAETIGMREALSWLKAKYIGVAMKIETNCMSIKTTMHGNELLINSYFAILIHDCKFLVSDFTSLSLSAVRKSANQVTHVLVRASGSMSSLVEWVCLPSIIIDVLLMDASNNN